MSITAGRVRGFAKEHLTKLLPNGFQGRFFLAGGCFKSLIHGKAPNDLDLWPASLNDRRLLLESLICQGSVVIEEHGQFHTVLKNPALPFRIEVTRKCPPSKEECVADFDIELACVAAEYSNGTVVEDVYIHAGIAECIECQEIRAVSRLLAMTFSLRTLERLDRYGTELGFHVCDKSRNRVWDSYTAASEERRTELLDAAGMRQESVPEYAAIRRVFVEGKPTEPCRPFTTPELDALRRSLVSPSISKQRFGGSTLASKCDKRPVAIYVVGLSGAGKGTVLKDILSDLGVSLEGTANLDMDFIRSFHGQFTNYIGGGGDQLGTGNTHHIYKELISWFNEGSQAEEALYKTDKSIVVRHVLSQKCNFILPVHTIDSLDFIKFASSEPFGYVPYLIEIRVPLQVALRRAIVRANVTGRYTPPEYIQESMDRLAEFLPVLKEFVEGQRGGVVASFDNSREGGGGLGAPLRIQQE